MDLVGAASLEEQIASDREVTQYLYDHDVAILLFLIGKPVAASPEVPAWNLGNVPAEYNFEALLSR
jgi:hypothetical protein